MLNFVPPMDSQSVGFGSVHCTAVPRTTGLTTRQGQKPKRCEPVYSIIASAPRICAYSANLGRMAVTLPYEFLPILTSLMILYF